MHVAALLGNVPSMGCQQVAHAILLHAHDQSGKSGGPHRQEEDNQR
jgi:hypothetical protein